MRIVVIVKVLWTCLGEESEIRWMGWRSVLQLPQDVPAIELITSCFLLYRCLRRHSRLSQRLFLTCIVSVCPSNQGTECEIFNSKYSIRVGVGLSEMTGHEGEHAFKNEYCAEQKTLQVERQSQGLQVF